MDSFKKCLLKDFYEKIVVLGVIFTVMFHSIITSQEPCNEKNTSGGKVVDDKERKPWYTTITYAASNSLSDCIAVSYRRGKNSRKVKK